mmetsp:Transcript_3326/g.7915  ORF Transcript_3326/g.7915 Transcript_3326/m.7915 type:complete len:197 (+) Transcript_3326:86-676(+)
MKQSLVLFAAALPAIADAFLAFPGASCVLPLRPAASAARQGAPALHMSTPRPGAGGGPGGPAAVEEEEKWMAKPMDDWMIYATKESEQTEEEWQAIEAERRLAQPEVEKELEQFKKDLDAKMAPGRAKEEGDQAFLAATEAFETGDMATAAEQWKLAGSKWEFAGLFKGIYAKGFKEALGELQGKITEAGGTCPDM